MSMLRLSTVTAVVLACAASQAIAQQMSARISSTRAQVGESLSLSLKLINVPPGTTPTIPRTKDFRIELPNPNPTLTMMNINGRRSNKAEYLYFVEPLRKGPLNLPPFRVAVGGRKLTTRAIVVNVEDAPPGTFFRCDVQSSAESVYVGQPITLTLFLWTRVFSQGRITLDERQMWGRFGHRQSSAGVFANPLKSVSVVRRRIDEDGEWRDFYVYSVAVSLNPKKSGPLDLGDIELVFGYPIELKRNRGFGLFEGPWKVSRHRFIRSRPQMPRVEVKAIPLANRPPDFNGALGRCTITAEAKPRSVPVGDPITLTLTIRSKGDLDRLSAPRLDQVDGLTRDFEVPSESLAGEIGDKNKVFNLTVRARREDVTEIPPIPMSYFDPNTDKFRTAWSQPIPIAVTPAERLTLSLDPESAAGGRLVPLVETTEGLLANFADPNAVLGDQTGQVGTHVWVLLGTMPVLYLCTWLVQRRVLRLRDDDALRRRNRAYAHARRALRGNNANASHADVASALLGYIADRCNVPSGGMTRADAVRLLGDRAAPEATVRAVDTLLGSLEQSRYGGAGGGGEKVGGENDLASTARQWIDELERLKLK